MKKISIALFSVVAMAGVASAQQAKGSGAGSAAAGTGVKAGAGSAATGAKAGAGASAGAATGGAGQGSATAAGATKTGANAGAPATTGAAMEMPKPPAEIAATMKMAGARQNCKGVGMGGADMKTEMKFTGTVTRKVELDGWWIHETMTGAMGSGKTAMKMRMESYMTYDTKLGKWRNVSVMNDGTQMVGTADIKDGKIEATWDTQGGMGPGMFRDHGDMTDKKVGTKMWGEMSMDKGKTWMKVYDMTCK